MCYGLGNINVLNKGKEAHAYYAIDGRVEYWVCTYQWRVLVQSLFRSVLLCWLFLRSFAFYSEYTVLFLRQYLT